MKHPCKIKQHKMHPGQAQLPPLGTTAGEQPRRAAGGGRGEPGLRGQQNQVSLCTSAQFDSSALTNPFLIELYRPEVHKREIKMQPESHTKRRIIPGKCFCSPGALDVQTKTTVSLAPPNSQQRFATQKTNASQTPHCRGSDSAQEGSEPQPGCTAGTPQHPPPQDSPRTRGSCPEPSLGARPHAGSAACSHGGLQGSVTCTGI